jgi:hypothetical protein
MSFTVRLLLALCVFAGMIGGVVHSVSHNAHDECAAHHCGDHDSHDDGAPQDSPHHHDCCHFPSAVSARGEIGGMVAFQPILVEISPDVALAPEEPVFALDKPPLI